MAIFGKFEARFRQARAPLNSGEKIKGVGEWLSHSSTLLESYQSLDEADNCFSESKEIREEGGLFLFRHHSK